MNLEEALAASPVVAILRGVRPEEVVAITEALYQSGVRGVEVPLNSPEPLQSIQRLTEAFGDRMVCGAGTVVHPQQVHEVAEVGGRIIVAPNTNPEVIRRSVKLGLDPAPGFGTASEAFEAIDAGARHLKLFPAATYGVGHVRQLKAVLPPEVVVWAVGGVGASTMADWWAVGVRAFGIGSEIYLPGQTVEATHEKARKLVAAAAELTAVPVAPRALSQG